MIVDVDVDEAERRIRSRPSLLTTLTPEQLTEIQAYEGPEIAGRGGPKRKDLRP
jgi:hypothetical protein